MSSPFFLFSHATNEITQEKRSSKAIKFCDAERPRLCFWKPEFLKYYNNDFDMSIDFQIKQTIYNIKQLYVRR